MDKELYVLDIFKNGKRIEYEYIYLKDAQEHLAIEKTGNIYSYKNGEYMHLEGK